MYIRNVEIPLINLGELDNTKIPIERLQRTALSESRVI